MPGDTRLSGDATIGEIWLALEKRTELLAEADRQFGRRADYALWRRLDRRNDPLLPGWDSSFDAATEALNNPDPLVAWGGVVIVARHSRLIQKGTPHSNALTPDEVVALAPLLDRTASALAPIEGAETSCALARLFAVAAVNKVAFEGNNEPLGIAEAATYFDRMVKSIQGVQPAWEPGAPVRQWWYRSERPFFPYYRWGVATKIGNILFDSRAVALHAVLRAAEADDGAWSRGDVQDLLDRAFLHAYSAWKQRRWIRHERRKRELNSSPERLEYHLRGELLALERASQAARDAGKHLLSARLSHMHLYLIPTEFADRDYNRNTASRLAFSIRQAGLMVDPRMKLSREGREARERSVAGGEPAALEMHPLRRTEEASGTAAEPTAKPNRDLAMLRVHALARTDPDWMALAEANPAIRDPRKYVQAQAKADPDDRLDRAAFRVALGLGQIKNAVNLSTRFSLQLGELGLLVDAIRAAQGTLPFAIDQETMEKWRKLIARAAASVPGSDGSLRLHDFLVGRGISIVRTSGPGAELFARRMAGDLDRGEVAHALDGLAIARRGGIAKVNETRIGMALHELGGDESAPVLCSLVSLEDDRWAVLAVGENGNRKSRILEAPLASDYQLIEARGAVWCRDAQIAWHCFKRVREEVLLLISEVSPSSRTLLLAVEPEISPLPWQLLFLDDDLTVSQVPGLSWLAAVAHDHRPIEPMAALHLKLGGDADIRRLTTTIERDRSTLKRKLGTGCIVAGHGSRSADATIVNAGRPLSTEDWMGLFGGRLAIIHSCFGAAGSPVWLNDMGGLPGLALSLEPRLFCAPVVETPEEVAVTLHQAIVAQRPGAPFADAYRAAIEGDQRVATYNLHGLPGLRLG